MKKLLFTGVILALGVGSLATAYFWLSQPGVLYRGTPMPTLLGADKAADTGIALVSPTPYDSNFNIYISSLDINAPIKQDVDGSRVEEYLPNVLAGVAHYRHKRLPDVTVDGALPGQPGNIFLFGHSQIPGGDMSNFKGVFNNLPKIKVGERIIVIYQGQVYKYEVTSAKKNVDKSKIHYLEHTDKETLTLMTCWPLGLDIRRFVVRAKRVR